MRGRLRRGVSALSVAALIASGCADDGLDPTAEDPPAESGPPGSDLGSDGPGGMPEQPTPTEPAPPFAGLDHASTSPVIALCDALSTRDGEVVEELLADDAIATDHTTGTVRRGADEIRTWIDDDLSLALFERTECGAADGAIASHFWSALAYRHYSDTTPGGSEGITVVGVLDGRIDRLEFIHRLSPGETDIGQSVSPDDQAALVAWCEAWDTLDLDRVLALTTDDVRVTPNSMALDDFFRPRPGEAGIRGAMDFVRGGNLDGLEGDCREQQAIANGGWNGSVSVLVDDESDTTLGGVNVARLRDGLVSDWITFDDILSGEGTLIPDPAGRPLPGASGDPAAQAVIVALETVGWWEFAGGYLGADLEPDDVRAEVAADVMSLCAFLATGPPSLDDVLLELDRIGERRATSLGIGDLTAYSLVLDSAVAAACPAEATVAAALRPPADPSGAATVTALRVRNPRPGDLRTDPTADTLPRGYTSPSAFWTVRFAYGEDPAHLLDLHLPPRADAPVVLYLHGGGWSDGGPSPVPAMVMRFVEQGYAVASVGYRLAPDHQFPAQVHDVKRAIRWLKAFGERGGLIDGERILAYGYSAGGHLAAFAAATPGSFEPDDLTAEEETFDSSVAGVVSVAGPTDLVAFSRQSYRADVVATFLGCDPCDDAVLAEASPLTHVSPDLPPAYWAYGADDVLVDPTAQGAVIASAWADAAGLTSSWFDLIEGHAHNIPSWAINQRSVEAFAAAALAPGG